MSHAITVRICSEMGHPLDDEGDGFHCFCGEKDWRDDPEGVLRELRKLGVPGPASRPLAETD